MALKRLSFGKPRGVTFVEILLGITILVFALTLTITAFQQLVGAETSNRMRARADKELQSVAEQIRYQTASSFDSMTEDTPHVRPTSDTDIQVSSEIEDIASDTRTRSVTLTARWMEKGSMREKVMTFAVAQMRAKMEGAALIVQANDAVTGVGIEHVKVMAHGQDIAFVYGETDASGALLLQGVRLNAVTAEDITIDGTAARAYHAAFTGEAPNDTPNFVRVYKSSTQANVPTYLTVSLIGPGRIHGRVTEGDGTPVPNAHIRFAARPNSQVVEFPLPASDRLRKTDANGNYSLERVVSGDYWVYMAGDDDKFFAAVGEPGDLGDVNQHVTVPSGGGGEKNFTTFKRGHAVGTARILKGDLAGNYYIDGIGQNLPLHFSKRQTDWIKLSNGGTPTNLSMANSFAWSMASTYLGDETVSDTTDSNGRFRMLHVAPFIAHSKPEDFPHAFHHSPVRVASDGTAPSPLLPVLAYAPNGFSTPSSDVKFIATYLEGDSVVRPSGSNDENFYHEIYPNRDNDEDVYVVSRDVLANLHGRVLDSNGNPFNSPFTGLIAVNSWTPDGPANAGNMGIFRHDLNRFDRYGSVATTVDSLGNMTYDLKQAGMNALMPNVGGDVTWIKLNIQTGGPTVSPKDVADDVTAYTKILNSSGTIDYVQIPLPSTNINDVTVKCYVGSDLRWTENVDVANGRMSVEDKPASHSTYQMATGASALKPREDKILDLTLSAPTQGGFEALNVTLDNDEWVNVRYAQVPSGGAPFYYNATLDRFVLQFPGNFGMTMRKILTSPNVSGTVRSASSGAPLAGVVITLRRSSGNAPDVAPFAPLTTTTDINGAYSFADVKFVAEPGKNLFLRPSISGYEAVDESGFHAYDGMALTLNYSLTPLDAGGNDPGY